MVSLVATVFNERESIDAWMAGVARQSLIPDEIVIVDGGSVDGTFEALSAWHPPTTVRLIREAGATIAQGRNRAIGCATGAIIAVTDAGTVAHEDWLAGLVCALDDPLVDVAAGFFVPAVSSAWDAALAAATLPQAGEINPSSFLPSSRSMAFRRSWFDAGIRYPEWLDYCEDIVFDLSLRRAGARIAFVPDAVVEFRVRHNLIDFWRQYFRYARGDGKAGLFPRRHALRYGVYIGVFVVIVRRRRVEVAMAAILGAAYLHRPLLRLVLRANDNPETRRHLMKSCVLVPVLRLVGDLAKMAGYPAGLAWRVRRYGRLGPKSSWSRIPPESQRPLPELRSRRNRRTKGQPDA